MGAKPEELRNLADFWESRGDHTEAARLRDSAGPYIDYDIKDTLDLMAACQDIKTAGYDADVSVQPRNADGWLIIDVTGNYPGVSGLYGQYWFWADGTVMQVL